MLSIKPLNHAASTVAYFFDKENYYVDGEVALKSRWVGKGAEAFHLNAEVDRTTFAQFLDGTLPNRQALGRHREGKREHRPGIDLTFSAPKSVSLLALVLGHAGLTEDHENAVTATLAFVETQFAQARMKTQPFQSEIQFVATQHLTAALFQHPTSRALDPQLHTHAIVMNLTKCPDEIYRSLSRGPVGKAIDAYSKGFLEQLFHNQRTVGAIYRGFLAHDLVKRGAEIEMTHRDARFEVVGVSKDLMQTFSTRREEIERELARSGYRGARAAAVATVKTNRPKAYTDIEALMVTWQSQCTLTDRQRNYFPDANVPLTERVWPVFHGLSIQKVVGQVLHEDIDAHKKAFFTFARGGQSDKVSSESTQSEAPVTKKPRHQERQPRHDAGNLCDRVLMYATAYLNERDASFTWQALVVASIYYAKGHLSPLDIMQGIEQWLQHEKLIGSTDIQGKEARLTTPSALALENDTIFWMQRGQDTGKVDPLYTADQLTDRFTQAAQLVPSGLTNGQRDALIHVATTAHRVIGIQGNPGVGKTTMLRVAHVWINEAGGRVIGLAASADAAKTLSNETGMASQTIASFLTEQTRPGIKARVSSEQPDVIIVDEASLVSTGQMNHLIRLSHERSARLILVGDINQFGAIQHGKPFFELMRTGMKTAHMHEIIRQRNPRLKQAVYEMIHHNVKASLDHLSENITILDTCEERLKAMASAYVALTPDERAGTRVATPTREQRDTLNDLIREGLTASGYYQGKQIRTPIYRAKDLARADKALASSYGKGEVVRFNRRYKRLNIDAGEYLTVLRTDQTTNTVTLEHDLGGQVTWRPHKVAGRQAGVIEVFEIKERHLAAGDLLRWTRNDHQSGKLNGQCAKVVSVNILSAKLAWLEDGQTGPKTTRIWFGRSRDYHWDYAYAWTTRSLQGQTCDRILINQPAENGCLTHEKAFLTGISRAKETARLFTNDQAALTRLLETYSGEKSSAIDALYQSTTRTKEHNKGHDNVPEKSRTKNNDKDMVN